MTGKITTSGPNSKLILTYAAITEKIEKTVEYNAHYLWDLGQGDHGTPEEPIKFIDLEQQDWIDIVFSHWLLTMRNGARQFWVEGAKDAATSQAQEEIDNLLIP